MMTRKDYRKFAKVLKKARHTVDGITLAGVWVIQDIEKDIIDIFKEDNPDFDVARFIAASNIME